jgi:nucleotide sugar dehydrogenase
MNDLIDNKTQSISLGKFEGMEKKRIGIVGIGFVGGSISHFFNQYFEKYQVFEYDKYKEQYRSIDLLVQISISCDYIFVCLPTPFDSNLKGYDVSSLKWFIQQLLSYRQNELLKTNSSLSPVVVFLKSTTTTGLCEQTIKEQLEDLDLDIWKLGVHLIHNPEFLSAKTAIEDFEKQSHIVLGQTNYCSNQYLYDAKKFYTDNFPNAEISLCSAKLSETMKICVNSFYASKIMVLNEYYLLCQKMGLSYEQLINLMLKNGWINQMHTRVPGADGKLGYGGACFPKDTKALLEFMNNNNIPSGILKRVVEESEMVRY